MDRLQVKGGEQPAHLEQRFSKLTMLAMTFAILKYVMPQ